MAQVLELATQPGVLFDLMGEIMEFGVWGFGSTIVNGWFLGIIWIIEALIVLFMSSTIPPGKSGEPYCEFNQTWFKEKQLPALSYLKPEMRAVSRLEQNNFEAMKNITIVPNSATESRSIFTLFANETNENYLSIQNRMATLNNKGETKFTDRDVVTHLRINEEFSNFLETI